MSMRSIPSPFIMFNLGLMWWE